MVNVRHWQAGTSRLPCPSCTCTFRQEADLKRHSYSHVEDKKRKRKCSWPSCSFLALTERKINEHYQDIHLGLKEYKCHDCGFETAYKAAFTRHQQERGIVTPRTIAPCKKIEHRVGGPSRRSAKDQPSNSPPTSLPSPLLGEDESTSISSFDENELGYGCGSPIEAAIDFPQLCLEIAVFDAPVPEWTADNILDMDEPIQNISLLEAV